MKWEKLASYAKKNMENRLQIFKAFKVLLAKQWWQLNRNGKSFMDKVVKDCYFPKSNIFKP